MTDDLIQTLKDSPSFPDLARFNFDKIVEIKRDVGKNFLDLAFLLVQNRDYRLWEFLNFESFEAFLGTPEIGFKRSTAYDLMRIYDLYISKLHVTEEEIIGIDRTKLLEAAKVIEKDHTKLNEWVGKAKELSKSDLKIAVGEALGVNINPPEKPPFPLAASPALDSCCVCGKPAERAHFPITRGSGGQEVEDWWIPLCREEHENFHADPKGWTWTYKHKWAAYLYSRINEQNPR